jgi:hypothetical protein
MTRDEIVALAYRVADEEGIPRLLLLGTAQAESNLNPLARRPTTPDQDATYWPDVSGGLMQQTVLYDPDYKGGASYPGPAETARVLALQYDPERSLRVGAKNLKGRWDGTVSDDAFLAAMYKYNWPAGKGRPYSAAHAANYQRGLREARAIMAQLPNPPSAPTRDVGAEVRARVLELARKEIGKRYAGPIVGEPDSYRWGSPGWDCSSFVSAMYDRATAGQVKLVPYTDAAHDQSEWVQNPQPGDIVFYHYEDEQAAYWPHMGLWLSPTEVLDARYGKGVGIHPHVTPIGPDAQGRYRKTMRPKALARVVLPDPAPPVQDPRDLEIAHLKKLLAEANSKLGVASVDYVRGLRDLANALEALRP